MHLCKGFRFLCLIHLTVCFLLVVMYIHFSYVFPTKAVCHAEIHEVLYSLVFS